MTPTREQVIEAAQAAGVPDLWLTCMTDLAFEYLGKMLEAARAQALEDAEGACDEQAKRWPNNAPKAYVAHECARAVEALKGKQ